jgi:hypothetical protein
MVDGPGGDFEDIRAFAREIAEAVESVPDHTEAYDERNRLLGQANALAEAARCEVAYGMFAESSAGKSLLVGALLGDPLLLPVAARTVTCNITVLRLRAAEIPIARIGAARAEYLDAEGLDGYARHLWDVTSAHVDAAGGDAKAVRALPPRWSSLPALREALRDVSTLRLAPNVLRDLGAEVSEMLTAADALAGSGLGPGDTEDLTPDELWEVVDHGEPGAPVSARAKRRSMVRRVVAEVDVPAEIWSPTLLYGARIQLVDVPGSGSGRRPIRDDYLRIQELDAVDTAMFFLESRPGSLQDSRDLQDLMSRGCRGAGEIRDSVLVVAGKFDRLEQAPDNLLAAPRVAPEEAAVLRRAPTLRDLVTAARALVPDGRDDRIFFVSPIVTIALAGELDLGWQAGEVAAKLAAGQAVNDARLRVAAWREVGAIPGALGAALRAFTTDGGLDGLRKAMVRHAEAHGVDLRLARLRADAEQLRIGLERLQRLRERLGPVVTSGADVRTLFEQVLGDVSARAVALGKAVPVELGDPEAAPRDGLSPAQLVRADVERAVYDWPEWKLLFDAVQEGRVVAARQDGRRSEFAEFFSDAESAVPDHAQDFVRSFESTCLAIRGGVVDRAVDRLDQFLRSCSLITARERGVLDGVFGDTAVRELVALDAHGAILLLVLDRVTDLNLTTTRIETKLRELPEPDTATSADSFPLDPGRALPWHPDSPRRFEPSYCGEPQVLRLRREMIRAVAGDGVRALADAQAFAANAVREALSDLVGVLDAAKKDSARWITIVAEARARAASDEEAH